MQIDAAKITEQGVTFAIVVVKRYVLSSSEKEEIRDSFTQYFGNIPIILMSQDSQGIPTYDGRTDIVDFLVDVPLECIPFSTYTFS
ncbi:hypothetical protein lbkm_0647 [Lachnospiraceae bacterium KM106-2]|nr:hypothetical protein lbkm_0647 [Lachnospiraceae bacterium KM106-2]